MSTAESNIELFGTLNTICLVIAILAFLLAVFFFFYFKIPTVFALKTGRAKKKTLERIQKQNSYTDKIRHEETDPSLKSDRPSRKVVEPPVDASGNRDVDTALLSNDAQTSVLSNDTETALLSERDDQTSLLHGDSMHLKEAKSTKATAKKKKGRFEILEEVIMIHTQELI